MFGILGIAMLLAAIGAIIMYFARPHFSSRDKLPLLGLGLIPVGLACFVVPCSGRPTQASGDDTVGYANNDLSN